MRYLSRILPLILLLAAAAVGAQLVTSSRQNQRAKGDYAELNSVKYGLFSIDTWKDQLTGIVTAEVDRFSVSPETEREMREHIAVVLGKMIDEAAAKIQKANSQTTGGKIRQAFIDMFVDVKDVKKGIPEYTDAVMKELKKPKTTKQLKSLVGRQVTEFATKTADRQDHSRLDEVLRGLGAPDAEAARARLGTEIPAAQHGIAWRAGLLIGLGAGLFGLFAWTRGRVAFAALVGGLLSLLAVGVATPMIDMEAKISQLKFVLIGHPIAFENQILYFQSKSIFDVFWLMITDDQPQMKAVAVLVVTFSLIFPLLKLLATTASFFGARAAQGKVGDFFVHKSGKWSMADVLVVAIFMAYIGFNGVINSQLKDLNFPDSGVDLIATNGTSLQPGYYVFLSYVVLSLLLSSRLTPPSRPPPPA